MICNIPDVIVGTLNDAGVPVVVTPINGVELGAWASAHRPWIDDVLRREGALLCRGFGNVSEDAFGAIGASLCGPLLRYVYRSTPRTSVGGNVYTATEYRADAAIPLHNENAYQRDWPLRIAFFCAQPAIDGGETPIGSIRRVTARVSDALKQTFAAKGVMYVRNYGHGVDLPWETVFQTDVKAEVETFCRHEDIACEWLDDGRLRTTQVCPALVRHPHTHEELWFNQAHLFHASSMGEDSFQMMLELFGEANLPRHACYGDGTSIETAALDEIRAAYAAETVAFPWDRGDVLLLDNMLVAHGRAPYVGTRRVLVAMGTPVSTVAIAE
jgi:hypothetical protein